MLRHAYETAEPAPQFQSDLMKTLGLLGGMSWESSIEYERIINEIVRERLGGVHSADLIIRSFDFATIEVLQQTDDWNQAGERMAGEARSLQRSGAEAVVLCTNTMHRVAEQIEAAIEIPLLHIADATASAISNTDVSTVALLGTRYTMEQSFMRQRLEAAGVSVVIPCPADATMIHDVIFDELVQGIVSADSRQEILAAAERLTLAGADGIVAGCTEIELLISPEDLAVPLFPTARLHAEAAAHWCLEP